MYETQIFHGTTEAYHNQQLELQGFYSNWLGHICLSENIVSPIGYANQRARQYNSSPILLIIDEKSVSERLMLEYGVLCINNLTRDEYFSIKIPIVNEKRLREKFLEDIAEEIKKRTGHNANTSDLFSNHQNYYINDSV